MAQQNVKPNGYRPRIVDKQIERYMRIFGAVEIAGTKWCGKTWAARAHANSITYVDRDNNLPMAQADLLPGEIRLTAGAAMLRLCPDGRVYLNGVEITPAGTAEKGGQSHGSDAS